MGSRGNDCFGGGRTYSLSFAEIVLRWSITSTWPASMAARLDEAFGCDAFGGVAPPSPPSLAHLIDDLFCGGETGAFKLKRIGRWSFNGISFLSSSSGLDSGLHARFMIGAPGLTCVVAGIKRESQL